MVQVLFDVSSRYHWVTGTLLDFGRRWLDGKSLIELAPNLVAVVDPRTARIRTVREGLQGMSQADDISGKLTIAVLLEYLDVWARLETMVLHEDVEDRTLWRWTGDGQYSASSAYATLFICSQLFPMDDQL
uniref:Uncharacterized protein n=1 Tax=Arundo donax TaxID=35708 RepID=A0A0A9A347_ARUDO